MEKLSYPKILLPSGWVYGNCTRASARNDGAEWCDRIADTCDIDSVGLRTCPVDVAGVLINSHVVRVELKVRHHSNDLSMETRDLKTMMAIRRLMILEVRMHKVKAEDPDL